MNSQNSLRILLSAYACEPNKGSEPGVGWNWALSLVRAGHEVYVLTRSNNRTLIESVLRCDSEIDQSRLTFIYYDPPKVFLKLKRLGMSVNVFYSIWQFGVKNVVKSLHSQYRFSIIHHISFGVWRQSSRLSNLGVPFIFGPVGGGEVTPYKLMLDLPIKAITSELIRVLGDRMASLNPFLRACLKNSSFIVAKTPETALRIESITNCHLVSPEIGVDATKFLHVNRERASSPERLRCLFAGRLLGWKGVHLAIGAIIKSRSLGSNVSLTIVGKGPMQSFIVDQIRMHGLQDCVHLVPWLSQQDLFSQYLCHDVLLFPSLHDSSGNVVLEALAHRLPVVCLDLGGPAILVDEMCGVIIRTHGRSSDQVSNDIAVALCRLHRDTTLLERLSDGAHKRALQMSWEAAVKRVYLPFIYGRLCDQKES